MDEGYKFSAPLDYGLIEKRIREILDNYESCFNDFAEYREMVKAEKEFFRADAAGFIRLFD